MSKPQQRLADAEKIVATLELALAKIATDTASAGAVSQRLVGERLAVERLLADGAPADIEQLERDERTCAATLRGLAHKRVETREALNVANAVLRAERIAHGTSRAQDLRIELMRLRASMAPMESELRGVLVGYSKSITSDQKDRYAETAALADARRELEEANSNA